jgi:hypothetical protein
MWPTRNVQNCVSIFYNAKEAACYEKWRAAQRKLAGV